MPALLFSFPASAASTRDHASAASYALASGSESVLTRWHDYALASITPQFTWAALPATNAPPRVLDQYGARLDMPPLFTSTTTSARVAVSVASGLVGDTPGTLQNSTPSMLGVPQSGVERTVVTPSLVQQWDDGSTAKLSAVLAYQRFATLGLGTSPVQNDMLPPIWAYNERFRWGVGYQSRVGMDPFSNYRGVYSDAGDFDIPASASVGVSYSLTPTFGLDVGVQRVMYSAITPFTSASLPTRFLALLGDTSSPTFAWRDLTVYSLGWTMHANDIGNFEVRYTTRQQPMPTSVLLEHALAPDTANDMVSLGWSRPVGENAHMSVAASYASSPYILMMPTYNTHENSTASQLEFEAFWSVRF
jgi:hypothetical protein